MQWKTLYNLFRTFLLELLFEKDLLLIEIEKMSPDEFRVRAKKSSDNRALFCYKDPLVKTLIWNMKFRRNEKCFRLAGELLKERIGYGVVIPVPLSDKRRRERGYNQVELDGHLQARGTSSIVTNAVKRKHTPPQTSLSRKERLKNLRGVFTVDKEKVSGKDIIIVDDVITTGATVAELERVLREAGARSVRVVALAH